LNGKKYSALSENLSEYERHLKTEGKISDLIEGLSTMNDFMIYKIGIDRSLMKGLSVCSNTIQVYYSLSEQPKFTLSCLSLGS